MNSFCKFLLAGLLVAVTTLAVPLARTSAQSAPEPAVVISIANFQDQMADVDYLVDASGFAQMKFMAKTMITQYIKGVDTGKPAGIMMYFAEGAKEPDFLGFVPVSNLDDLLDTIAGYAEVDEGDDFITVITDDETELLIKEVGGNAFFSNKKEMFDDLPSDPVGLLGELPTSYNLAAQVFGQRIPQEMRTQALDMIRDGYESQLEQLEQVEPVQAELQRKNFELQMKQFSTWINQTDNFTIGMCADKEQESLYMDIAIAALDDSELASRFAASAPESESLFSGFLIEGATFTQNTCMGMHPDEAEEYSKMMDQLREAAIEGLQSETDLEDDEIDVLSKTLDNLMEIGKETLKEGKLDSGAVVMLKDDDLNFAMGARLANPAKLETVVKDLVAFAEQAMPGEFEANLNSGSHKDVTFHEILITVPEDEQEMRDVLGDQLTLIVGIGKQAAYFGAGTDPMPLIKQAMDGKQTETDSLLQYNLYLGPMMRFIAGIEDQPGVENMAAELESNGKDRMSMTSKLIDNGVQMRFEMQDGILALIKVGFESMNQGGIPGGNNDF